MRREPADGLHGDRPRPAHRRRGVDHPGRPRGAGHRHGAARERRPGQGAQAAGGQRRVLQRDPSQAAAGGDRGRRRVHLRRLPESQELGRERHLRTGGGDAERAPSSSAATPNSIRSSPSSTPTPAPGAACAWRPVPTTRPGRSEEDGKAVAIIDRTACKGCGGCVPVCPKNAIDLQGYTDAQITGHDRRPSSRS